MKHKFKFCNAVALFAFAMTSTSLTAATVISQTYSGSFPATISGTLPNQDTVLEETFTLPSAGGLTAYTTSYASGGFEPNLTLFTGAGSYVASSGVPGSSSNAQTDPTTGTAFDAYLSTMNLSSGTYILALTDFLLSQAPTATNLADGFTFNLGSGTSFVDQQGNTRTGAYSLVISTASTTATPEPASLWCVALALLILVPVVRKRFSL